MIRLHRLNGQEVVINADLIENVEAHPDTVIQLASNNRFIVKESITEVIRRIIEYRKAISVDRPYLPEFLRGEQAVHGGKRHDTH